MPKPRLTPAEAARLYSKKHMSVCEIAQQYKLTRQGVASRIRAAGLGGVMWCTPCGQYEELALAE